MSEASTDVVVSSDSAKFPASQSQPEENTSVVKKLADVDMLRQVTLILALLIALAMTIFILIWANEPDMRPLAKMETEQLIPVLDSLDKNNIDYELLNNTISVTVDDYQKVKLLLAREGLGLAAQTEDYLQQDSGFGVSQRLEQARLKFSQEQNLAKAIEQLQTVSRAKVILALPKENVFARKQQEASATVVVTIARRMTLAQEEIDAIVDIVASAVHGLNPKRVTVTDQTGRLLNSGSQDGVSAKARRELEITKAKESEYLQKIETILMPILGLDNFSSQVDVAMDFTAVEQTNKTFNSQDPAIRSEMLLESNNKGGFIGGIPGALSNQPPIEANIPQGQESQQQGSQQGPNSSHKEQTRNYELDSQISYTRSQVGVVQRVTISVAVNYRNATASELQSNPELSKRPISDNQMANIRRLLEGAVGFSASRGDVIEVVNVPFQDSLVADGVAVNWFEQPVVQWWVRLGAALLVIIVIIMAIIKPLVQRLIYGKDYQDEEGNSNFELAEIEDQLAQDTLGMLENSPMAYRQGEDGSIIIPNINKEDDMLKAIRSLVANEPELSIQVIKSWIAEDA
ncbi:flagellar basal-body MS-ring/collar protein FliF [Paraferrimonas sp. SM1919]|uniref:flagellar basal-body MS-ring/collar protein FliF n=1 Tax=Paraferrimonas sp. SM1919 TaxID=2662263 RepID=UPI001F09F02C|nr:flagellar basal-body MS-ring/collar protein FliF [Paraferrimonas sp. SM1919]